MYKRQAGSRSKGQDLKPPLATRHSPLATRHPPPSAQFYGETLSSKRTSPLLIILIAAALVLAAVWLGNRLLNGGDSLLRNVTIGETVITPNADGDSDATPIRYELSRNATVTIYFEDAAGDRFFFRQAKARGAGEYEVLFSGVVDGYRLADEPIDGEILARLLGDGDYTWTIEATDFDGVTETQQGLSLIHI